MRLPKPRVSRGHITKKSIQTNINHGLGMDYFGISNGHGIGSGRGEYFGLGTGRGLGYSTNATHARFR